MDNVICGMANKILVDIEDESSVEGLRDVGNGMSPKWVGDRHNMHK